MADEWENILGEGILSRSCYCSGIAWREREISQKNLS